MKKTILKMIAVAGIIAVTVFTSSAQISLGLIGSFASGMDLGIGSTGKKLSTTDGFGGGFIGRYWLKNKMAVGINVSYFSFGIKDVPSGITSNYSITPISLAFEYYFKDKGIKPFAGFEAGYMVGSWIAKYEANIAGVNLPAFEGTFSNSGLFIAPVVGTAYRFKNNFDIVLNAKFIGCFNEGKKDIKYSISNVSSAPLDAIASSFINVNLGVSYKFGK
ncbi:MAG: hypothetical protein ACOVSR_03855 [Bacteroidia bacterium]